MSSALDFMKLANGEEPEVENGKAEKENEGSEKKPKLQDKRLQSRFSEEQVEQLAEMVGIDTDDEKLMKEFAMGLEVEREHAGVVKGNERKLAQVAKDHLDEMENYYTELKKMESKHASLAKAAAEADNRKTVEDKMDRNRTAARTAGGAALGGALGVGAGLAGSMALHPHVSEDLAVKLTKGLGATGALTGAYLGHRSAQKKRLGRLKHREQEKAASLGKSAVYVGKNPWKGQKGPAPVPTFRSIRSATQKPAEQQKAASLAKTALKQHSDILRADVGKLYRAAYKAPFIKRDIADASKRIWDIKPEKHYFPTFRKLVGKTASTKEAASPEVSAVAKSLKSKFNNPRTAQYLRKRGL